MTFKEQLKNDINALELSEEYKNALSEKMAAEKKPRFNLSTAKICLSAAALCLVAFGAVGASKLLPKSSSEAASFNALSGSSDNAVKYDSYYADDSVQENGNVKAIEFTEAEACEGADPIEYNDVANECEDTVTYCGAAETTEAISTAFNAPVYSGETICTIQNTYCSDRPWYTAEEMANIIVKEGYKLARVKFGKTLTADEKSEQSAINSGFEGTYYHAEVDGADAVVYFFGSDKTQEVGNPIYGEGDEIYCALEEKYGVYLIREYPLGDIYVINGEEFIYLRVQPCEVNAAQLLDEDIDVTTTTIGNPARYYSAYPLGDFIGEFGEIVDLAGQG